MQRAITSDHTSRSCCGVGDDGRACRACRWRRGCGAARSRGDGEQAERVVLAQVVLDGERQLARSASDSISGSRPRGCAQARERRLQALELERLESARGARSIAALMGAPVLLEVADQRRAEVADRLLAAVRRHVLAEDVERLLADPQRAPVGDAADRARRWRGRAARRSIAASISPGATISSASSSGCELAAGEDRLARAAVADEARQAQVRGAGDDPLVARRAACSGSPARRGCGRRSAAAGSRRRSRTSPRRRSTASPSRGSAEPAVDLVHEAEVADREEQVGDLAAVEVGEVQARRRRCAGRRSAGARRRRRAARRSRSAGRAGRGRSPASNGPVVVSSSALRWRGLRSSTMPTLPRALDRRRAEVDAAGRARTRRGGRARAASGAASRRSGGGRCPGWRARGRAARPARSRSPPCPSAGARARARPARGSA